MFIWTGSTGSNSLFLREVCLLVFFWSIAWSFCHHSWVLRMSMSTVSFLAQLDAGILWILFFYKKRQFVLWTQLIQFRNWNQCAIWWKWGKKFCSQGKNNICKLILKSIFLSLIIVSIHNQWNNIANQPVINNQFVCPLV